ncbi:Hypothetical protein PHPALM_1237 [Phytophthora palmivora]|uniref:Uncharacterized protein n=1 Tax=Phytophthora palmivora TaxID=4796 RepID=A0A2P4YSV4_9STRA|nr:Hypothetical protein PHPALM_1237 [Phytophthora palmivora]
MQHLGAANVNNMKTRSRLPADSSVLPGNWLSIEPQLYKSRKVHSRSGPDALGLTNIVDPLTFFARKPNSGERGVDNGKRQNPRRRRLRPASEEIIPVTQVFSPHKSLRFAKLPMLATKQCHNKPEIRGQSNQLMAATTMQSKISRELELPLHELIQTMDDAVKADPLAELNQTAIARLFMDQWFQQFEADRRNFKSIAVRYEVGFEELQRRTVNLPRPNELITSFCCRVLGIVEDLTPHFGSYAPLFRVLSAEIIQSIYARDGLPYFAHVKHHNRLLLTLRKDKAWREERNEILAEDIDKVYAMFRHFLSECTYALSRMLLHEWYSTAVVQKKNNTKYVTYFSNWFSSSPKAILRKVYVAWKREAALHRVDKIQKQMNIDLQGVTVIKRQVDDLTKQRDVAQADNLVMRNDRKQAEEWTRQLELRIKAASTYLDTTHRREAQVCQEGQLRVEAVACLPPLILESLLRGYHGVGFLQHAPVPEADIDTSLLVEDREPTTQPDQTSVLLECLAEISRLRNIMPRQTSVSMTSSDGGKSNSVATTAGKSNSVVSSLNPAENGGQPSSLQIPAAIVASLGSPTGRRAAGAVSQDEQSGQAFAKIFCSLRERILTSDAKVLFTSTHLQESMADKQINQHKNAQVAQEYQHLLRAIRIQDEHYASHAKLFSSRMLESHEISLVPNYLITNGLAGTDKGDLGVINGVKRFWIPEEVVTKSRTSSRLAPTRRQTILELKDRPQSHTQLLENLDLIHEADFDISPFHSRGFTILLLAHITTEYGSLLFSPSDMSAFTHNAYLNPPSEKLTPSGDSEVVTTLEFDKAEALHVEAKDQLTSSSTHPHTSPSMPPDDVSATPTLDAQPATIINNSLRIIQPIVTAYSTWNHISEQLISAGVVESRGLGPRAVVDPSNDGSGDVIRGQGSLVGTPIRPMLQHQFEPLSHSSFLAPAKDKSGRRTSITSGDGNTYRTARIRHLAVDETEKLIQSIEVIHKSVKDSFARMKAFNVMYQQLRELRVTQWHQASDLASQFVAKQIDAPVSTIATGVDHREHVFECISFTNSTMRRIFSVEENPELELTLVRAIFEKHQRVIRQLYTPFRANINHAMSLDEVWHVVKILRLPREIHVLPILRDEELVANGYEQLFSPVDLAELFLQLCNEQFQPQIAPLSARVECFVTRHLPIALQNQSLIRALMHHSDVKLAISSHSQTIRMIFRRYSAKERELMMPSSGSTKSKPRHTGHGINKYMRMVDWQAFVQDYRLVRARFSMDQAMNVFRNVQEAPPGHDDQLELIYSEFCEALVGMAAFYFPDPFLKTASKLTQFLRRYLPLSPDDAHDHA